MKKKKRYSSANINEKSSGKISVNDQAGYTTPKKGNMKRKPKTSLAGSPDVSKMAIEDNIDKESNHQYFHINVPEEINTFMWNSKHLKNAIKFVTAMQNINSFPGLRSGGYYSGVPKDPTNATHVNACSHLSWHKIFLGLYDKWNWHLNKPNIPVAAMTVLDLRKRDANMNTTPVTYRKFTLNHGEQYAIFYLQEYVHRSWLRFAKLSQKHPKPKIRKMLRQKTLDRHNQRQRVTLIAAHKHTCNFENCSAPVMQRKNQSFRYCKLHLDGGSVFFQKWPGFHYIQDNLDHGPYAELMSYYAAVEPALPICKFGQLPTVDLGYQVITCDSPCDSRKKLCQNHFNQIKAEGFQLCNEKNCMAFRVVRAFSARGNKKCLQHSAQ